MTDLDKRVEWLRARVPIEDVYLDHVRFIMKHYAEEYHQNKLNNNVVLGDVVGRSEQLVCDYKYHNRDITTNGECTKCESHKWR